MTLHLLCLCVCVCVICLFCPKISLYWSMHYLILFKPVTKGRLLFCQPFWIQWLPSWNLHHVKAVQVMYMMHCISLIVKIRWKCNYQIFFGIYLSDFKKSQAFASHFENVSAILENGKILCGRRLIMKNMLSSTVVQNFMLVSPNALFFWYLGLTCLTISEASLL